MYKCNQILEQINYDQINYLFEVVNFKKSITVKNHIKLIYHSVFNEIKNKI